MKKDAAAAQIAEAWYIQFPKCDYPKKDGKGERQHGVGASCVSTPIAITLS